MVTCREPLKMQLSTNLKKSITSPLSKGLFGSDVDVKLLNEALINEIGLQASKDNLELGCEMIKKAVIVKALTKVREDTTIMRAIEARRAARSPQDFKSSIVLDKATTEQIAQLPH